MSEQPAEIEPPTGQVIEFPARRSCFLCAHYTESYCQLFDEHIDSEIFAAKDCHGYEPGSSGA